MRAPGSTFDLRAALCDEVRGALGALETSQGNRKAVRACRVRLKRARSLARVGHTFAPGLSAVFNNSARSIMRSLAEARDLSALAKAAQRLAKKANKRAGAGLKTASEALDGARQVAAPIDLAVVNAGLRDLLALAQVSPEASPRQVKRGARRLARRARRAWRKGRDPNAPAQKRHEWRQREKDRLYAAALMDGVWPRRHRRRASKRLVDRLGREHDLMLLTQRLEASPALAGDEANAKAALKLLRAQRNRLTKSAHRLGMRLHARRA